jgi:hypothetical protein
MIPARISIVPEAVSDTLLVEVFNSSTGYLTHCSLARDLHAASVPPRRRPCATEDVRYPTDAFLSGLENSAHGRKRDAVRDDIDISGGLPISASHRHNSSGPGRVDADTSTIMSRIC